MKEAENTMLVLHKNVYQQQVLNTYYISKLSKIT